MRFHFFTMSVVTNILITVPSKKEKLPLTVTHPELAKEADGWDPSAVSYSSKDILQWQCSSRHTWSAKPVNRSGNGLNVKTSPCPVCSGQIPEKGRSDLATLFPEISGEADGWEPSDYFPGSNRKMPWKCNLGHRWQAVIYERAKRGSRCPFCANSKVMTGFNDLQSLFPDLAAQADGWDPTTINPGSQKKLSWKCPKGHIWISTPMHRTRLKQGCAVCDNKQIQIGVNDLQSLFPEIAKQADGWNPTEYTAGSHQKMAWVCKLGHKWKTTIGDMTTRSHLCPYCSNQKFLTGLNDLATLYPELASEADGWDPSKVHSGTKVKKSWRCSLGHTWSATLNSRTLLGAGCPFCSNHKVWTGFNDLKTKHPDLAKEAFGWDPSAIGGGASTKLTWKCTVGHIYKMNPISRTSGKQGCPICSNKKVLTGFNDLATTHPLLAQEAIGWDPKSVTFGSGLKRKWKCSEGHTWTAQIASRANGRGCPTCSKTGFDPNLDGFLYFISHPDWLMLQIGITNDPDKRLAQHRKLGWELLELRGPMDGHLTQQWETAILRMLKAKGADLSNEKIAGKFDGYSEAWSKSIFEVNSIKELMRLTEEFESNSEEKRA